LSDSKPNPEPDDAPGQQTFLDELFGPRSPAPKLPGDQKPGWQRFLESTGGAALITVILGTMGGAAITGLVQSYSQRQLTRQAGIAEYIKGEHDTVKAVFDLVGQCIAASESLNTITTSGFNPNAFQAGPQREIVLAQKDRIRNEFNKSDEQWRSSRETLTLNMRYYHGNDPTVASAWDRTRETVSSYMDCQHHWYIQNLGSFVEEDVAAKACVNERQALDAALVGLSDALAKNRLYQWGDPKS